MKSRLWIIVWSTIVVLSGCTGSKSSEGRKLIRVMSYNVHHGVGSDSTFDIYRIADVITQSSADIVALQDVDRWVDRTGRIDMMTKLADLTGMTYTFAKSMDIDGGEHGNGLLTRFPILEERPLLYHMQMSGRECGLMRVVLDVRGTEMVLMNTELSSTANDSVCNDNVREIEDAAKEYRYVPIVLCCCLNSTPESNAIAAIDTGFYDCWTLAGSGRGWTYPATMPARRVDYIFVSTAQVPTDNKTPEVSLKPVQAMTRNSVASVHLPVVADLKVISE